MKTDLQIAAEAYDATRHHSNGPFAEITNPNFRSGLIEEVKLATEGRSNTGAYAEKVAELVAVRAKEVETAAKAEAERPAEIVPANAAHSDEILAEEAEQAANEKPKNKKAAKDAKA